MAAPRVVRVGRAIRCGGEGGEAGRGARLGFGGRFGGGARRQEGEEERAGDQLDVVQPCHHHAISGQSAGNRRAIGGQSADNQQVLIRQSWRDAFLKKSLLISQQPSGGHQAIIRQSSAVRAPCPSPKEPHRSRSVCRSPA
eukprot:495930-Prymnesium_polylepis.1